MQSFGGPLNSELRVFEPDTDGQAVVPTLTVVVVVVATVVEVVVVVLPEAIFGLGLPPL